MSRWLWMILLVGCAGIAEQHRDTTWTRAHAEAVRFGREYIEENTKFYNAQQQAENSGKPLDIADPTPAFAARAWVNVHEYTGTDGEIPYLAWLVHNSDSDRAKAIDRAMSMHQTSTKLSSFVTSLLWADRQVGTDLVYEYLGTIRERNPSSEVQAEAIYARARFFVARYPAYPHPTAEQWASMLEEVNHGIALAKSLPPERVGRLPVAPDDDVLVRLRGLQFEATHLQIGQSVPDIVGKDLDQIDLLWKGKIECINARTTLSSPSFEC